MARAGFNRTYWYSENETKSRARTQGAMATSLDLYDSKERRSDGLVLSESPFSESMLSGRYRCHGVDLTMTPNMVVKGLGSGGTTLVCWACLCDFVLVFVFLGSIYSLLWVLGRAKAFDGRYKVASSWVFITVGTSLTPSALNQC